MCRSLLPVHRIRKGRVYCYETRSFIRMYPGICIAFDSLWPGIV